MSRFATAAALALGLAAPAAQAQYDPAAPRSLNQVDSINRSMMSQQENRASAAQNQFETNALRNQLSRPALPSIAPAPGRGPVVR